MCQLCLQTPCHPNCPNCPAPAEIYTCEYCSDAIIEGDEYIKVGHKYYHMDDCINDAAISILVEELDATIGVAEVDDGY